MFKGVKDKYPKIKYCMEYITAEYGRIVTLKL